MYFGYTYICIYLSIYYIYAYTYICTHILYTHIHTYTCICRYWGLYSRPSTLPLSYIPVSKNNFQLNITVALVLGRLGY